MIRLEGVSKVYDDKVAVNDLELEIPQGSVFGLIGPNGAGKTTTLKMVATLIKPERGRIVVDGLDLGTEVRRVRRILGYMPDEFGTFRGLSCAEYLEFFGRMSRYHGRELSRRVDAVLSLTELGLVRDEATTALSSGMRQRLSLAKTLLHDPRVLVLDEPASGLDPRARIEIRSLLKELGRMGKTLIISSHILADLEEICTDVGIIEQGKLVWSGPLRSASWKDRRVQVSLEVAEEDVERAAKVLGRFDWVARAAIFGNRIEAELAGRHGNEALKALLESEVEVLSYSLEKVDLEALFLERTRGIVS